jgi:competence protein ComEA
VLTFGAAVLLSLAAWWALRAVPAEEPVPQSDRLGVPTHPSADSPSPGTPSVSTPVDGVPAPAVTAAAAPALVVDVTGKVRRPGIVELSPGSRVVDALAAAGGARPGVDTTGLNLARLLVDGEQIVVGLAIPSMRDTTEAPAVSAPSTGPALGSINVNTASQAELETLPDIGPVTAQAIVDWRRENGSFASVDQLVDVSGIGEATLQDIEPYVHV